MPSHEAPCKKTPDRHSDQESGDDGMPHHQTCAENKTWTGKEQYMAENVPKSVSVVQLSIAHYSDYSYNDV